AAVGTIFADSVQRLVPTHPLLHGRTTVLALVFGIVAAINVLGVKLGARLNMASTIAKLLPLALLIVTGVAYIQPENLEWRTPPTLPALSRASVFLIFVFAGIESAMVPSGEVREPSRTVPRAVLAAMVIVTIVYILIQVTAQGVLGASLVGRTAPLADVAEVVMGPVGGLLLGVGVILSTFGYLCGMILAIPRALFAFARDGVLPLPLANVHPKYHTPWIAIITQAALSLALALSSGFEPLVILANVSVLFVYLGCAAAAWQLRRRDVRDESGMVVQSLPGAWLAPPLAILIIVLLLSSVTRREWAVAGMCAGVGFVLYLVSRVSHLGRRSFSADYRQR